jgi:hypothetical protein
MLLRLGSASAGINSAVAVGLRRRLAALAFAARLLGLLLLPFTHSGFLIVPGPLPLLLGRLGHAAATS